MPGCHCTHCSAPDGRLGGPYLHGEVPAGQGARMDLVRLRDDIIAGNNMRQLATEHFSAVIRYTRGIDRVRSLFIPSRNWVTEIYAIVGPTGTGKTRLAWEMFPNAYAKNSSKWWDGYDGHQEIVLNEMGGHVFPYTELLELTDRYPHSVQNKGGTVPFVPHVICFTSNYHPKDWYDYEALGFASFEDSPLHRRFQEFGAIIFTGEPAIPPRRRRRLNPPAFGERRQLVEMPDGNFEWEILRGEEGHPE